MDFLNRNDIEWGAQSNSEYTCPIDEQDLAREVSEGGTLVAGSLEKGLMQYG